MFLTQVVVYKILYIVLFLFCVVVYQVSICLYLIQVCYTVSTDYISN